jgi:thioredoxin 1
MIAPSIEAIAQENGPLVQVVKMNVDENTAISQRYGIKGIPTLIVFKDGREVERMVGAGSKEALSKLVDRHIAKAA